MNVIRRSLIFDSIVSWQIVFLNIFVAFQQMNLLKSNTLSWEQRKLSNIADIVGGGTPSTSNPDYWDGDIDWYTPAEIGEQIFANGSVRKITKDGLNHSSAKILPAHKTVLFTSRAGIGSMAILQRLAATNQGFQSLVCHDDIDPYFVFSMGDSIKTKAERVAAGSTFAEISGKKLGDLELMFPSTDEQKAIGNYFKNLDNLITLHQRKYDMLKKVKKAMFEKMFPKNGKRVPEIRFAGFTDDWEQRKLGELATFTKGAGYSKSDLKESGTPVVLYGRLYTKYETVIRDVDTFVDAKDGSIYSRGGEVVVPASGETAEDIAIASVLEKSGILIGGDLNVIHPCNRLEPVFLAISISNGEPHVEMARRAQGKSVVHLHNEDLSRIELQYPEIAEQQKISQCFLNLDHLITLHQRKLEKLNKLKKSMLEEIFV